MVAERQGPCEVTHLERVSIARECTSNRRCRPLPPARISHLSRQRNTLVSRRSRPVATTHSEPAPAAANPPHQPARRFILHRQTRVTARALTRASPGWCPHEPAFRAHDRRWTTHARPDTLYRPTDHPVRRAAPSPPAGHDWGHFHGPLRRARRPVSSECLSAPFGGNCLRPVS